MKEFFSAKFTHWLSFPEASCFYRKAEADGILHLRCFVFTDVGYQSLGPPFPEPNYGSPTRIPTWWSAVAANSVTSHFPVSACLSHGPDRSPNRTRTQAVSHQSWGPETLSWAWLSHQWTGVFKNVLPLAGCDWQLAAGAGGFYSSERRGSNLCPCSAHGNGTAGGPFGPQNRDFNTHCPQIAQNKKWSRLQNPVNI